MLYFQGRNGSLESLSVQSLRFDVTCRVPTKSPSGLVLLVLPITSGDRSLVALIKFGEEETQHDVDGDDDELLDHSHDNKDDYFAADDVEDMVVKENLACGVDEPH